MRPLVKVHIYEAIHWVYMKRGSSLTGRTGRQGHHVEVDVLLLEGVVLEEGELGAARLGQSSDGVVDAAQVFPLAEVRVGCDEADVELLLVAADAFAQAVAAVRSAERRRRGTQHGEQQHDEKGHQPRGQHQQLGQVSIAAVASCCSCSCSSSCWCFSCCCWCETPYIAIVIPVDVGSVAVAAVVGVAVAVVVAVVFRSCVSSIAYGCCCC